MGDSRAYVRPAPRAHPGKCRSCNRARDVFSCGRSGGGNYRRPNRRYRSAICAECVVELGPLPERGSGHSSWNRWDLTDLRRILESLRMPPDEP